MSDLPLNLDAMKTKRDVILGAVELLETRGHTKGAYEDHDGCLCAVGAIVLAGGGRFIGEPDELPDDYVAPTGCDELIGEVLDFVAARIPDDDAVTGTGGGYNLTNWNDEKEREADEVLSLLRGAAAELIA